MGTTAMDSATMVATTDWDTMDTAWDTTWAGAGRRGLLTPPLLLTPRLTPTTTMAMDTPTMVDTMAITCMERGPPTLLLLLTLRLTPTFSMATTAMATAILTMVVTTGAKLFLECQIR